MRGNEMVRFIPFEAKGGRVETGATQIGNDWPGLFIRGDDCIGLWNIIGKILRDEKLFYDEKISLENIFLDIDRDVLVNTHE